jgi:hypothetical protein
MIQRASALASLDSVEHFVVNLMELKHVMSTIDQNAQNLIASKLMFIFVA